MQRIYAYLRASTKDQDARRARGALVEFVEGRGLSVAAWFEENESGATLKRPELFRLLDIAQKGDVLLIEQVDRISRLNAADWDTLKATINAKGLRVVALDLPTSHTFLSAGEESFTARVLDALNAMLLDVLAAAARKDYEDRRRRQVDGVKTAQKKGKYQGRPPDLKKQARIEKLLRAGVSWKDIAETVPCSTFTIRKVRQNMGDDKTLN